jgi:hypothetical protein
MASPTAVYSIDAGVQFCDTAPSRFSAAADEDVRDFRRHAAVFGDEISYSLQLSRFRGVSID